jgi:hypothetical protein
LAAYDLNFPAKRIFQSNLLLILCCAFYLAWWLLAFKPAGAVRGMKTGWLLIPAFVSGLAAILLAIKGIQSAPAGAALFPSGLLLWGGIALYFLLLAVTRLLWKRPVTTELLLIVGWTMLALSEINTLYGTGRFSLRSAVLFAVVIGTAALISLVCYVLYYNLGSRAGYFDGMVPLLLVALVAAGISAAARVV